MGPPPPLLVHRAVPQTDPTAQVPWRGAAVQNADRRVSRCWRGQ